jgi:hypothetical protein
VGEGCEAVAEEGCHPSFVEEGSTDQVGSGSRDVKDIFEDHVGRAVPIPALYADGAPTNGYQYEVVAEAIDMEWVNCLVHFEHTLVIKDMPIRPRIVMAHIVASHVRLEDR